MPTFRYRALNAAGRQLRGSLSAINENDLYYRLKAAGLDLVDARAQTESRIAAFLAPAIGTRDLVEMCVHMEQLERVGVPILDALHDIREATESIRLRDILTEVARDVANGSLLSEALARHPKVFNKVFVGLIGAGEKTGRMGDAFSHLVRHLKWIDEMNQRVRRVVRYPLFLLSFTALMLIGMMLFLVPQMTDFLDTIGVEQPAMTVALIHTSNFVQAAWPFILAAPFACWLLLKIVYATNDRAANELDSLFYRLPLIGPTMRKVALARFCHFFAMMFQSGIGILQCISYARETVPNRALATNIELVRDMVEAGNSLTDAMRSSGEFPSLVIRMVKIGEETGNLRQTLDNIAYFYDRDVEESINTMISSLQPVLTGIIGLIMAWVIVAVLGPVWDSFSRLPA